MDLWASTRMTGECSCGCESYRIEVSLRVKRGAKKARRGDIAVLTRDGTVRPKSWPGPLKFEPSPKMIGVFSEDAEPGSVARVCVYGHFHQ